MSLFRAQGCRITSLPHLVSSHVPSPSPLLKAVLVLKFTPVPRVGGHLMESCPVQGVVSWAARGLCATVTGTFLAQPALVSVGSALEAHFWVGATNTSAFTLAGCLVCFSLIWSSVVNLLFYSLFPVSVEKHRVLRVRYVPVHAWPGLCVNNTLLLPWPRGASPLCSPWEGALQRGVPGRAGCPHSAVAHRGPAGARADDSLSPLLER